MHILKSKSKADLRVTPYNTQTSFIHYYRVLHREIGKRNSQIGNDVNFSIELYTVASKLKIDSSESKEEIEILKQQSLLFNILTV